MKRVYTASGLPEAYLLKDYLESQGIDVVVFNEHSAGAVGEIPTTEVLPQLWVRHVDQYARARQLAQQFEIREVVDGSRTCTRCDQESPTTFEFCWNCGQYFDQ